MARSHGIVVQNKFTKGLISESTALNFPEDACTDTDNCLFDHLGRVERRLGIDLEGGHVDTNQTLTGASVVTYQWKNVGGDGDLVYVVVQIGDTLHFYKVSASASLSSGKHANTIALSTFFATGVTSASTVECQFSQGNGYLFVTNPNCDPFYISFNAGTNTFSATKITIQQRDFTGVSDSLANNERPTSLTDAHRYNLANQGWSSRYLIQSATSITIGTGSKAFTTTAGMPILVGDRVRVYSRATPGSLGPSANTGNIMIGTVTAYSGTTLTVNVTATNGAGTLTDWNIIEEPDNLEAWNILFGNYPNNNDVWFLYKNTSGVFAPTTEYVNKYVSNNLAPRGHFILNVFNQDRAAASGITSIVAVTTGTARPSTCAFFAGRVFYGGIQNVGYNARIYFSQILDDISRAGFCYQAEDPTSETLFDLLPTDGGYVDILEAGQILKLVPMLNSLIVICTNGVWSISGSQGMGFVANDYSIHKVSAVPSQSANSLVEVNGVPIWWTPDGIVSMEADPQTGQFSVKVLIGQTILSFYQTIPLESRRYARGVWDPEDYKIQWLYRSTASTTFNERYTYDRMLTLNMLSGAFFPWSISATPGRIHGAVAVRAQGGTYSLSSVTAASGANIVQSGSGANNVIVFSPSSSSTGNSGTLIKYLTSYINGANTPVTFSECYQTTYKDWETLSTTDFTSYFVTGYRIHGEGMRKYQTNYVSFFSDADATATSFKVRGEWDFSTSGSSGRWSTVQIPAGFFKARPKRLKIRGHGLSCQLRVESVSGQPFSLIGWAAFETGNPWI